MIQTWIMRKDIKPTDAAHTGADSSICGDCQHRGIVVQINGKPRNQKRSCYVVIFQAPLNIYNSYRRGIYSDEWNSETFAGLKIRIGSYGDPAAVPLWVWQRMLALSAGNTGYTHQWRRAPELAAYCMASCDSADDALHARMLGFRTFRVRRPEEARERSEARCGASNEMGNRTNCASCMACGGTSSKAKADIVIAVHGSKALQNAFVRRAA